MGAREMKLISDLTSEVERLRDALRFWLPNEGDDERGACAICGAWPDIEHIDELHARWTTARALAAYRDKERLAGEVLEWAERCGDAEAGEDEAKRRAEAAERKVKDREDEIASLHETIEERTAEWKAWERETERLREGIEEWARRLDSEADSLDIKRVPLTVPAALWGIVDDLRALAAYREDQPIGQPEESTDA